jgi:Putative Ig domain
MRICGKEWGLLAITALALAGCGGTGESSTAGGAGNLPPIISGSPPTSLTAGTAYSFTPQAADPDGDILTFSAVNLPRWATVNKATGAMTGTPAEADVGMTGMITIEVSDSRSITELPAFRIQVSSAVSAPPPAANLAPTITGTPATAATVGQAYTFTPVGDDPNDDTLTFTIVNKPSWATFTTSTGQLTGTPISANIGAYSNIIISVSDGDLSTSLPAFSITVAASAPVNRPPTLTGTPATTVVAGAAYSFRPVGSDPDGNTLLYSIQNKPAWAAFSATNGRLTGTPTTADVGTSARITISVTDNIAAAVSLPSFTIQVTAPANRPPTISGTPIVSILVGGAYSFQPSAADADGDPLTFSINNKPAWATFNTTNGALTGTPAAGDVAVFNNIMISVSDGKSQVALAAFSITVLQVATGSATVSWTAPTTNNDGSALTNLAGYRVAYGRSESDLSQSASVNSVGVTTYAVNNLATGAWYFAVYAVNSAGIESDVSNVATKTIP